jgi:hypothetical protein
MRGDAPTTTKAKDATAGSDIEKSPLAPRGDTSRAKKTGTANGSAVPSLVVTTILPNSATPQKEEETVAKKSMAEMANTAKTVEVPDNAETQQEI